MRGKVGLDRDQVVAEAARLADELGIEGLTLGRLAQRLGVKTPSLYNHVTGLPDLHAALAQQAKACLAARLARSAVGKAGDDAVFALAGAFRAYIKDHPALYGLTVRPTGEGSAQDRAAQAVDKEIIDVVLAALSAYDLDSQEAVPAVRGLRSLVHGFSTLELTGGFGLPLDADASFRILCETWLAGLRTRPRN